MKRIVIANWKMNMPVHVATVTAKAIDRDAPQYTNVRMVLCPSAPVLPLLQHEREHIALGAQNFYPEETGNVTGEISVNDIAEFAQYAIIGHSERRTLMHEDNTLIKKKVEQALHHDITPILCVGENAEEKRFGRAHRVIRDQLEHALPRMIAPHHEILIAYEPVWAISGGSQSRVAEPQEIADAVKVIHDFLHERYGRTASQFTIIYGGSTDQQNTSAIAKITGVSGALIGKASLDATSFLAIAKIFNEE